MKSNCKCPLLYMSTGVTGLTQRQQNSIQILLTTGSACTEVAKTSKKLYIHFSLAMGCANVGETKLWKRSLQRSFKLCNKAIQNTMGPSPNIRGAQQNIS